jgi:hypothetical protein
MAKPKSSLQELVNSVNDIGGIPGGLRATQSLKSALNCAQALRIIRVFGQPSSDKRQFTITFTDGKTVQTDNPIVTLFEQILKTIQPASKPKEPSVPSEDTADAKT